MKRLGPILLLALLALFLLAGVASAQQLRRLSFSVTTDASGDATVYSSTGVNGRIISVQYVKTNFTDGVDFDLVGDSTGSIVWAQDNVNASATVYPRVGVTSTAGVALTYDGTRAVSEPVPIARERLKLIVAAGGNATTGVVHVVVEGGG